jgi:hypothetical protein
MRCPEEVSVASLALGLLEPHEQARLTAHVAGCPVCQTARDDFAELVPLLGTVTARDLTGEAATPSELAYQRLRRRLRRRSARRWWYAAAAALIAVAGTTAVLQLRGGAPSPATVTASAGGIDVSARLTATSAGTTIRLSLRGVRPGESCRLVAVARDGHRETASTWVATYQGTATVDGTVAMGTAQMSGLVVETLGGQTLVSLSAP